NLFGYLDCSLGTNVRDQVSDAVITRTGEQPQLAVTALTIRKRLDNLDPRIVGPQKETNHGIRVGTGQPLSLRHGLPPADSLPVSPDALCGRQVSPSRARALAASSVRCG